MNRTQDETAALYRRLVRRRVRFILNRLVRRWPLDRSLRRWHGRHAGARLEK
jgi:hypothetical protein